MKLVAKKPERAYVCENLWLPKGHINADGIKGALTFTFIEEREAKTLCLWQETPDHLIVPREFWDRSQPAPFEVVDCRPLTYPRVSFNSHITLDAKNPHETVQRDAFNAMVGAQGGILQLACVSGDTVLNLSRNGKGFKMTIQEACCRMRGAHRYTWNEAPTYIRSKLEDRIGLNLVEDIIYRGKRMTYVIELEGGKKLRLTSDHEVLTTHGWCSIDTGLGVGVWTHVITDTGQVKWGKKEQKALRQKPVYKRLHWYPSHPFAHRNGNKTGPRSGRQQEWTLEEHRAVAEAMLNNMTLEQFRERCRTGDVDGLFFINPSEFVVHHRDENPKNNHPDNLEVVPKTDHHVVQHPADVKHFGYGVPVPVRIKSITPHGMEDVYDVVCADPHHNFVANGIVVHNCGRGKTVIALAVIAHLQVPALIVVDNTQLLSQWRKEIKKFLGMQDEYIGLLGDGSFDWKKPVVLATYQTLAQKSASFPQEIRRWFGVTIWDEAHHVAAPTFSRSVDMFYGRRYGLTATPDRIDGMNVVYEMHLGPVLYKNLTQNLKPEIYFVWTGMKVDPKDMQVRPLVCDKNGELHLGKLAGYFGRWDVRLQFILNEVRKATNAGRKPLVLSNSVDELINLYAMWVGHPKYTDIPEPTAAEVGHQHPPIEMDEKKLKRTWARIHAVEAELKTLTHPARIAERQKTLEILRGDIKSNDAWEAVQKVLRERQREYLKTLLAIPSNAGLLTFKVDVGVRQKMLSTKDVIFSIMKYGKEGLDKPDLDTVFLCEPISQKNILQQVMGRALRELAGKNQPVFIVMEDEVGPMIGMCQSIRKHLREWPVEENGPYTYNLVGYPNRRHSQRSMSL